jgi:hypothetical protein
MTGFASKRKMALSRMSDEETQSPSLNDWGLRRAKCWELKLCWLPKKCFLSGKPLWGKKAYHAQNWLTGPGEPIPVDYWLDKNEFIMWNLKGKL